MIATAPRPIEKLLLDAARASGCTDCDALAESLQNAARTGTRLVDAVLDAEVLPDETAFFQNLSRALHLPFIEIPETDPDHPPHTRLPARLALRHRVLPARAEGANLELLTYDPFDLEARQMAGQTLDQNVTWIVSTRTAIVEALRSGYGVGAARFDELIEEKNSDLEPDALRQEVTVLEDNEEATIMGFVNQIFSEAIRERATDIHIEPLESDLRIRYRVDGSLNEVAVPPNVRILQNALVSRLKIMAHLDIGGVLGI